jgi:hypothetical protein
LSKDAEGAVRTPGAAEPGVDGLAELVGLGAGVAAAPLVLYRHLQRRPAPEHQPDALAKRRRRLGGDRAAAAVGCGHGVARVGTRKTARVFASQLRGENQPAVARFQDPAAD